MPNQQFAGTESGQVGLVRIKQEPEDSGLYGINPVPSLNTSEISQQIKIEPGTETTIKQEKDQEWSNIGGGSAIKTEPVDHESEHCHQCPVHSTASENESGTMTDGPVLQDTETSQSGKEIRKNLTDETFVSSAQSGTSVQGVSELDSALLPDNRSQADSTPASKDTTVTTTGLATEGSSNIGERNQAVSTVVCETTQDVTSQNTSGVYQVTIEPLISVGDVSGNTARTDRSIVYQEPSGLMLGKRENICSANGQESGNLQLLSNMDGKNELSEPSTYAASPVAITNVIDIASYSKAADHTPTPTTCEPGNSEPSTTGEINSVRTEESLNDVVQCKEIVTAQELVNPEYFTGVEETKKADVSEMENLDDILSKTVDRIYSEIQGKEGSGLGETVCTVDEPVTGQDQEKAANATPLRHSVEGRHQEALEFLKELNSLQADNTVEKSVDCETAETNQIGDNDEESGIKMDTLTVRSQKVRVSVELDKILSETVDRVYSEIQSETSSMTGSITDQVDDVPRRENDSENSGTVTQIQDLMDKLTELSETKPKANANKPHAEMESGTCEVLPIVIEPENDAKEELEKEIKGSDELGTINTDQEEEHEDLNETQDVTEFITSGQIDTMAINIEPVNCETHQEPERTLPTEKHVKEADEKSEFNVCPNHNEDAETPLNNEKENLNNSTSVEAQRNVEHIGTLTIEANNEQAALRDLVGKLHFFSFTSTNQIVENVC